MKQHVQQQQWSDKSKAKLKSTSRHQDKLEGSHSMPHTLEKSRGRFIVINIYSNEEGSHTAYHCALRN